MFGSGLDDDYCSDCGCESCVKKRAEYSKPYVYRPLPPGFYSRSFTINVKDVSEE